MKKIEASLLKRLLRISGQDLVNLALELSHYYFSLSYSWTQSFLGAFWHWSKKVKEGMRKQRSSRERQDQAATTDFIADIDLHVYFLARFGMHGIACGSFLSGHGFC